MRRIASARIRFACTSRRKFHTAAMAISPGSAFEAKYNADLANNLGNLVNRVASMTERYQQGRDPFVRRRTARRRPRRRRVGCIDPR
jgi:methionyl-tRNA synthetase